jgi:hypothetical protein
MLAPAVQPQVKDHLRDQIAWMRRSLQDELPGWIGWGGAWIRQFAADTKLDFINNKSGHEGLILLRKCNLLFQASASKWPLVIIRNSS